ncbi:MAG: SgcJ/EcaC family oxidoreductase [Gammaproteobacteria bacterium]
MTTFGTLTDKAAIEAIVESQRQAWNRGDANAFSEAFMSDGCFVNIFGALSYGREPFEAQHAKIFSTVYKGSSVTLPIRRSHFLRPDVAIVDIDAELITHRAPPPGLRTEADGIIRTRLQEILVKENGAWMVASFHNVDIKPGVPPPNS